jgi:hypothetical protein
MRHGEGERRVKGRLIQTETLPGVPLRKDIELLRCDFRSAASHCEAQRLCFPFPERQSSRIVPLASAPAGCAAPYSTRRDHCGARRVFFPKLGCNVSVPKALLNGRQDFWIAPRGEQTFGVLYRDLCARRVCSSAMDSPRVATINSVYSIRTKP